IKLNRLPEALDLHKETLRRRYDKLGDDNPDTLQSMNNVAVLHSSLGQHADALKVHEEALRLSKLHSNHPGTPKSMNAVAWILATCPDPKLRDPRRAVDFAKEAVKLAPDKGDY